jgi:hypothetical protein
MVPKIYLLARESDDLVKVGKTGGGNVERRLEEYSSLHNLSGFSVRKIWKLPSLALMDYAEIEAHRLLDKYQYSHNGIARELFRVDCNTAEAMIDSVVSKILKRFENGEMKNTRPSTRVDSYYKIKRNEKYNRNIKTGNVITFVLLLFMAGGFLLSVAVILLSGVGLLR